ncbi:MAG: helix-turn-helix domain-containing protein [Candidatus Aenigmatarchaeota archaeon]
MRRGREYYSQHYEKAMELHIKGKSPNEIAKELGISYSCAYHWVKGLRKPEAGNINDFAGFLEKNGPTPAAEIPFPKHNEIFLISVRRGIGVRRHVLSRKFREYSTWYYLPGQESILKERIADLLMKYKKAREKVAKAFDGVDLRKI